MRERAQARVTGVVQGVGFRPYVYRLAGELALGGYVLNDDRGVLVEVEGPPEEVDRFLARLAPEAPPLARVEGVTVAALEPRGELTFAIRPSPSNRAEFPAAPVAADTATCADCLAECFDPANRRHRYPFINCTNCGPRFTIVRGVPYDRPLTTMASFAMCPACRAEYADPGDRRFHAQPNACPECGPALTLLSPSGALLERADPLGEAVACLAAGGIVAVKGIGGFHLACAADDERAVDTLRARKQREDKPFAVMAGSLAVASELVWLNPEEEALLSAPARPIVLCRRRPDARVAAAVAPRSAELGVMLAYSPLHHLLLAELAERRPDGPTPLVMTSGNLSDEPIAYRDGDAAERLGAVADLLLVHDREIETRTDDSVLRVLDGPGPRRPLFVRRSRGYVPDSLSLPAPARRSLLACGAELKNTFCLARGRRAWVSHHIGDLGNYETLRSFTEGIAHFRRLFDVRPEVVAHDLHPGYLSTRYALEQTGVQLIAVQHHHAHFAACLAEHGRAAELAVGAIFDGSGLGEDGTVWGGELLAGDALSYRRIGSLRSVRLPGVERAVREPWRMACAWLTELGLDPGLPPVLRGRVDPQRWRQVARLARTGLQAPLTTSMGRLFDAVAALCGLRIEVTYEGQAAIELEAACTGHGAGAYTFGLGERAGRLELDPGPVLADVLTDVEARVATGVIAARFHAAVAAATVEACERAADECGTELVVLSGGVFLNRRLLEASAAGLRRRGLRVLIPERLPPGDGGIAYGQAAVAAARLALADQEAGP